MAFEDFGQKVSLTSRIQELLLNYPEGTSIFKELLQNADDARAKTISFCLDHRSHSTHRIAFKELAPFQGPSLLVHNDAVFTELDFSSIRHIGDSLKKGQVGKTGRYGLGFNSVYHLTDIPSFVSGKYLVLFDPSMLLPNASPSNPGKRIDLTSTGFANQYPDSCKPFQAFGSTMHSDFDGTLFRFPFRTPEMASSSLISSQQYTVEKMSNLLRELRSEAHLLLLFLKSVENLNIYGWHTGHKQPTLLFSCSLKDKTPALLNTHRMLYSKTALAVASLMAVSHSSDESKRDVIRSAHQDASIKAIVQSLNQHPLVVSKFFLSLECIDHQDNDHITSWSFLIGQACAGVNSPAWKVAQNVSNDMATCLVPWGSIALPLMSSSSPAVASSSGKIFCFLPLPASSCLPIHINGTFELSSNRRDLWYGNDLLGIGKQRAMWNGTLLGCIIAPLYAQMLAEAAVNLGPSDAFYRLWPQSMSILQEKEAMVAMVRPWLDALCDVPVGYTRAEGGRWITPKKGLFIDDRASKNEKLLSGLLHLNLPIITMPQYIIRILLQDALQTPSLLLPELLRQHARQYYQSFGMPRISTEMAAALLEYACSDLPDDTDGMLLYNELMQVPLIPVVDGSLTCAVSLSPAGKSIVYYVPTKEELIIFKKAQHCLVDSSLLTQDVLQILLNIASSTSMSNEQQNTLLINMHRVSPRVVSDQLLPHILPPSFRNTAIQPWTLNTIDKSNDEKQPTREWLALLWKWLWKTMENDSHAIIACTAWPIIPTCTGYLHSPTEIASSCLIFSEDSQDGPSAAAVVNVVTKLGCYFIDSAVTGTHISMKTFAHAFNGIGVLHALHNSFRNDNSNALAWNIFDAAGLEMADIDTLRNFLLQHRWFTTRKNMQQGLALTQALTHLKSLPIFPILLQQRKEDKEGREKNKRELLYVDLTSVPRFLPPQDMHTEFLSCMDLINSKKQLLASTSREADDALIEHLSIRRIDKATFYIRYVVPLLPSLPPQISVQILKELPLLQQQRHHHHGDKQCDAGALSDEKATLLSKAIDIVDILQSTQGIVRNAHGTPMIPKQLYDPRNADLLMLLDPEKSFPDGLFAPVLDQLCLLGLRKTADRDTIIQTAREIESLSRQWSGGSTDGDTEAASLHQHVLSRARALLAYLDMDAIRLSANPGSKTKPSSKGQAPTTSSGRGGFQLDAMFSRVANMLLANNTGNDSNNTSGSLSKPLEDASEEDSLHAKKTEEFWKELKSIAWIPIVTNQSLAGIPWKCSQSPTTTPTDARLWQDLWLVCSQYHIIDGDVRSPTLINSMGWSTPLKGRVLARQLAALGRAFTRVAESSVRRQLAEVSPQLYNALAGLDEEELAAAREELGDAPCIWIGDGFASMSKVALKGPLNLSTAGVYVIPLELAPFKDLLLALGIPPSFSFNQYTGVLQSMHDSTQGPKPIDAMQLEQSIAIATALADMHDLPSRSFSTIFLPDERAILRPCTHLLYNDAPWTQGGPPAEGTFFVHPMISHQVADRLGAASLRRTLLAQGADAFPMALTGAAVEAFGQSEALTTRLRHILESYTDGPGVLMELMQNADDAGARTVRFLLDSSEYSTDQILGPNMAAWQGPALVAWNDAVFSAKDVQNIARIGQDSKMSKPGATGRFGLGFNSVFHFTDLPSFVSGDLLVIFDPHASSLPGATLAQPGMKIRFTASPLIDHFPDSFRPYSLFGCTMKDSYHATLFRFPLRTADMAALSDIKPHPYAPKDVLALFEAFKKTAPFALLFLKSVTTVELYTKRAVDEEPSMVFSVSSKGSDLQKPLVEFVKNSGNRDVFYKKLRDTESLPSTCGPVEVTVSSGSDITAVQRYIISNVVASGTPRAMAVQSTGMQRGWVPWTGVAAPIPDHLHSPVAAGRVFCFLPLPTNSRLPMHINGFFELSSNRKDLWHGKEEEGEGKQRAMWNEALLSEGVAKAFVNVLEAATKECSMQNGDFLASYYALWPDACSLQEPWSLVCEGVYRLCHAVPCVWSAFRDGGAWVAPQDAIFVAHSASKNAYLTKLEQDIASLMLQEGFPVVSNVPQHVMNGLQPSLATRSGQDQILSPAYLRQLLSKSKKLLCATSENHVHAATLCLEYCLSDEAWRNDEKECLDHLIGIPLLPLRNGSLGTLSSSKNDPLLFVSSQQAYLDLFQDTLSAQLIAVPNSNIDSTSLLGKYLSDISQLRTRTSYRYNLCYLDIPCITEHILPKYLPSVWRGQIFADDRSAIESGLALNGAVNIDWISRLWAAFAMQDQATWSIDELREALSQWPLIPVQRGVSPTGSHRSTDKKDANSVLTLAAASPAAALLMEGSWTEAIGSSLLKLGCAFVSTETMQVLPRWLSSSSVQEATCRGVLAAMLHRTQGPLCSTDLLTSEIESLTNEERDALRSFLLQQRWFVGASSMTLEQMTMLKSLPIYKLCCSNQVGDSIDASHCRYTSLLHNSRDEAEYFVAPEDFPHLAALPDCFIHPSSKVEAEILTTVLGVKAIDSQSALLHHAIPQLSTLNTTALDGLMLPLLESIAMGKGAPAIIAALHAVPCIPVAPTLEIQHDAHDGSRKQHQSYCLKLPHDVYDPRNSALKELLGTESACFPIPAWASLSTVLEGLTVLGMQTALTPATLLHIAKSIDKEAVASIGSTSSIINRSKALISALDNLATSSKILSIPDEESFWTELKTLRFAPVHTEPPFKGLPWKSSLFTLSTSAEGKVIVAAPSDVRVESAAWLVSSSMYMLSVSCSDALSKKLGFISQVPLNALAMQLFELGTLYSCEGATDVGGDDGDESLSVKASVDAAVVQIYALLEASLRDSSSGGADGEAFDDAVGDAARNHDDASVELSSISSKWNSALLKRSPSIWVGDRFIMPSMAAIDTPADFKPVLYSIPEHLSGFINLWKTLGVPTQPTATQYITAMSALTNINGMATALPPELLALALSLLHSLAAVLADDSMPPGSACSYKHCHAYLVDADGILAPASSLYINDAPWLAHEELRMAHPDLSHEMAAALGAQSLRYHHQVETQTSERLPCFRANLIQHILASQKDSPLLIFSDILELADACKCSKVDIYLDSVQYPTQSLLQPSLSSFQGPALCFKLQGIVLAADELCRLQGPPSPYRIRNTLCKFGYGLLNGYQFCDVMQVVSGDSMFIFDPSAKYLVFDAASQSESMPSTAANGEGHAKQYRFAGNDISKRFSDQFAVWSWSGYGSESMNRPLYDTLIRFPLRRGIQADQSFALHPKSWTTDQVFDLLLSCAQMMSQSLLFATSLSTFSIYHHNKNKRSTPPSTTSTLVKQVSINLPLTHGSANQEYTHRTWCEEKDWKKAAQSGKGGFLGLSALSKQFGFFTNSGGLASKDKLNSNSSGSGDGNDGGDEHAVLRCVRYTIHVMDGTTNITDENDKDSTNITDENDKDSSTDNPDDASNAGEGSNGSNDNAAWQGEVHKPAMSTEVWYVATCAGAGNTGTLALDKRNQHHHFDPQAAVAVQVTRDAETNDPCVKPAAPCSRGGFMSPLPWITHGMKNAYGDKKGDILSGGGDTATMLVSKGDTAFERLPFTICGHFALSRTEGRRPITPRATTSMPPNSASSPTARGNSKDWPPSSIDHSMETTEHTLGRFNAGLLSCVSIAAAALLEMLVKQHRTENCKGLYRMLPLILPNEAAVSPELSLLCLQFTKAIAKKKVWKLRRGELVHLNQGCFLQSAFSLIPTVHLPSTQHHAASGVPFQSLSNATADFMQQRLPIFEVDAVVKEWLEGWGIEGVHGVSPQLVRDELKTQVRTGVLGQGGHFTPEVAAEILSYATSDVLTSPAESDDNAAAAVVNLDALRDCINLPYIDANGSIQCFTGSKSVYIVDVTKPDPMPLFSSFAAIMATFLHPTLAAALSPLLQQSQVSSILKAKTYSVEDIADHLSVALPSHWAPRGIGVDAPMAVAWSDGARGGPSVDWLSQVWSFIISWPTSSSSTALLNTPFSWIDALSGWALIPTHTGDVVRVMFRHTVVAPPVKQSHSLMDADHVPMVYDDIWQEDLVPALLQMKCFVLDARFSMCTSVCNTPYEAEQPQSTPFIGLVGNESSLLSAAAAGLSSLLPSRSEATMLSSSGISATAASSAKIEELLLVKKLRATRDVGQLYARGLTTQGRKAMMEWITRAASSHQALQSSDLEFLQSEPFYESLAGTAVALESSHGDGLSAIHTNSANECIAFGAVVQETVTLLVGSADLIPEMVAQRLLCYTIDRDALFSLLSVRLLDGAGLLCALLQAENNGSNRGFSLLQPQARERCLSFIELQWDVIQAHDSCMAALSHAEFVTVADGSLSSPSSLFDPEIPLLATAFTDRPVFPHGRFARGQWLDILRQLGLKQSLDRKTFMDAVHRISETSSRISKARASMAPMTVSATNKVCVIADAGQTLSGEALAAWETARCLADHLANGQGAELLHGPEGRKLAEELREVPFVPGKLYSIDAAAPATVLASYSHLLLPVDAPLAWTTFPVLDSGASSPPPLPHHASLRIRSPPPFDAVMQHVKSLGHRQGDAVLAAWPLTTHSPIDACLRLLEYLEKEGLSDRQIDLLRGVHLVAVGNGTTLRSPQSLYVRSPLRGAAEPLLYELPPAYVEHLSVLKKLGLKDSPTAMDMLWVVREFKKETTSRLTTPQIRAIANILQHILIDTSAPDASALAIRGEVSVPDALGSMVHPSRCIYGDASSWSLVPRLASTGLRIVHPFVSRAACGAMNIPSLVDVVEEELLSNGSKDESKEEEVSEIQGKRVEHLADRMRQSCVAAAVHSALESQCRVASRPLVSLDEVSSLLAKAASALRFVQQCQTVLKANKMHVLEGSVQSVTNFVSNQGDQMILAAAPGASLSASVAAAVSKLVHAPTLLPISALFDADDAMVEPTCKLLAGGGSTAAPVSQYQSNEATANAPTSSYSTSLGKQLLLSTTAGQLGAPLAPNDIAAVSKFYPLRRYSLGEIVAVRMPSGRLHYARIAADSSPPAGAAVFRITLEISPQKFRDVLSTEIFGLSSMHHYQQQPPFHDNEDDGASGESTSHKQIQYQERNKRDDANFDADTESDLLPLLHDASTRTGHTAVPSPSAHVSSSRASPLLQERERDQGYIKQSAASSEEVIHAVRSMLNAAGVTFTSESSSLLQQSLDLQQRLSHAEEQLSKFKEESSRVLDEAGQIKTSWQCRICLTREIDSVWTGCGHVLCFECALNMQDRSACPFCRKKSTLSRVYK